MRTELGSWRRAWRRVGKVGKAEVEVEEAEARRRARRTAACALIKSNNPHLAGGEQLLLTNKRSHCHAADDLARFSSERLAHAFFPKILLYSGGSFSRLAWNV